MRVAVIGAGIAGITAAYYIMKKGHEVTVYEKERYAGMKCSYANGGQISVSNSEVWTTWSNIGKAMKWIGRKNAPLLLRPSLDWDKAKWLWKFLWSTARNDADKRTIETIRLGIRSRRLYNTLRQNENIKFDWQMSGILHVYNNKKYFQHAKEMKDIYEENGCDWDIKTAEECLTIEPRLHYMNKQGLIGGIWTESDSVGDIHMFCSKMSSILETYGVKFFYSTTVDNLNELLQTFDKVVIANGSDACRLILDGDICVYPIKGYSITIPNARNSPAVSILDDEAKIVCSRLGDRLRVAGTAEIAGHNQDVTRTRITPLLKWVARNFPGVSTEHYEQWACLRPMTSDMMPRYGQSKINPKVHYHVGHGHLGWTLAPATAQCLAEQISR